MEIREFACSQVRWPPSLKSDSKVFFTSCLYFVALLELKKKTIKLKRGA